MHTTLLERISHRIARHGSTRLMVLLFLLVGGFFWLFNLSAWPYANPRLIHLSGGEGLLDVRGFYTAQQALAAMAHYGEAGRALYRHFLAADFVFIPIYSLGFALLLSRMLRALDGEASPWMQLNLLPPLIGLFDVAENLLILTLLVQYPHVPAIVGTLAGLATLGKSVLTVLALLLLGVLAVRLLLRKGGAR